MFILAFQVVSAGAAVPANCAGLGPGDVTLTVQARTEQYMECEVDDGPLATSQLVVTELDPYWAVNQALMFPAPQREYRRYADGAERFTPYVDLANTVYGSHACANGRTVKIYPGADLSLSVTQANTVLDFAAETICGVEAAALVTSTTQSATNHDWAGDPTPCPALFTQITEGGGYPEICQNGTRDGGGMLLIRYRGASWWPTVDLQGYAQGNALETVEYDLSGARITRHRVDGSLVMMTGVCNDQFVTLENSWAGSFNWGNYAPLPATEALIANSEMEAVFAQELTRRCPNGSERSKVVTVEQLTRVPGFDDNGADILRLYFAFFDRDPDLTGAKYWLDEAAKGLNLDDAAWGFSNSDEFLSRYGTELTDRQYLEVVYTNVLDRGSDAEGLAYWLGELEANRITRAGTVRWIAANAEFVNANPYPAPAGW